MSSVKITHFHWLHPHGFMVQWSVTSPPDGAVAFTLYRSGGQNGPWEKVLESTDQYAFVDRLRPVAGDDTAPNQFRLLKEFYYRVDALLANGVTCTDVKNVEVLRTGKIEGYRRKAVRDVNISLRVNGVPAALLKRRVWGVRCPKCYDPKTGGSTRGGCRTCWGTSYAGGYWTPVQMLVHSGAPQRGVSLSENKADSTVVQMTISSTPMPEHGDVIVLLDNNKRYRISAQSETQIQLATMLQSFSGEEIDHSNVIYELKVDPSSLRPLT